MINPTKSALPPSDPLADTDPRLLAALRALGREFGPLGVATAAAHLTDTAVLIHTLQHPHTDPGPTS